MSVQVIDNFSYKGKKGNFERDNFDTLQAMRSYPEDGIDDGHVCFCNEDGNHYKFNHLNSVDGATGRWRLHNKSVNTLTETGEGKVLDARQGKILKDLIDAKVIEAGGVSFDTVPTKNSINPVTSNGIKEAMDEQAESINSNMGVNDYPVFSTSEAYPKGKVVNYNGKLYKFTADHAAGDLTQPNWEETNMADNIKTAKMKLEDLDTLFIGSQSAGTAGTAAEIMTGLVPTVYDVMGSQNVILGKLFAYSDSMRHVITQVLFTSMTLGDNGALIDTHKDGITHMYYRTYGVMAPSLTNGKWTEWKQIVTELDGGTYMQTLEPDDTPITSLNNFNKCENHIYFASTPGTYTKAGNIVVEDGELALIFWSWRTKEFSKKTIYKGNISNIVQETGDSETAVMSQKAVTEKLNTVNDKINNQIPEIEAAKDAALNEIEDTEQEAILNFNAQRVTPEMLSEGVRQLIENSGEKTITNLPDDEDLSTTGGDTPVLKFKDKTYNPSGFSGLATKILRKNISGSKNVLAQEMVSDANTIYEIRYDFDLNGATITVPDNCVLKFNGGSIDNGTLKGTGTMLEANLYQIFGENLVFSGTFNIDEVYAEWWGAKSYVHKQSKINTDFPFWDTPQEVEALPDCSSAFNKALDFCGKYAGGVVRALATMYKVENTITIPAETSLYTEESTYFIVYMQGDGKTVVTQNLDTYKFSSETLDENAYTLDFNQLIATESMAVAFKMNSRRTSFKGRGTISINHSRYTIGLLINGNYYDGVDMSYRPYVDIRSVGGDWGQIGIDTGTDILDEAPTDDTLNETGKTLYAWDKGTKTLYSKANGQTTWTNKGYYSNYFNTSVRIDIDGGDCRLINPYICFGDARGFRGLEIYVHNGAWFNISKFEGCISYKHGGFISVFTDSAVVAHDWQKVQCQLDKTQYDCKFFYAAKAEYITIAAESDLPYISMPNDWKAFYLGKGTISITIPSIGDALGYVEDLGTNNKYNMYSLNPLSYQDVYGNTYFNILEGNNPTDIGVLDLLKVNTLREEVSTDELDTITDNIENVVDRDISYLFDGDPSTKETLIDIDNGVYGTVMTLLRGGAGTNYISTSIAPQWIEVDYYVHSNNAGGVYLIAGGEIGISKTTIIKKRLTRSIYERVEKLFIPVGSAAKTIKLAVASTVETKGLKVYVYSIKYWVNSYRYDSTGVPFTNKTCPKLGDTSFIDNKALINYGDAKNIDYRLLKTGSLKNTVIVRTASRDNTMRLNAYGNLGKVELLNFDSTTGIVNTNDNSLVGKLERFSSYSGNLRKSDYSSGYVYYKVLLENIREFHINNIYGYSSCFKNITVIICYGAYLLDTEDISKNISDAQSIDISFNTGTGKSIPLCIANFTNLITLKIQSSSKALKAYGNITDLPISLKTFSISSCDTSELIYSNKPYTHIWNEEFTTLSINTECTSMTTDMVDALLIDLAWCVKATEGTRSVSLPKMKRTAASDDAVAALEELGFIVNVPLQAEE